MFYVYLINSLSNPDHWYIGRTEDINRRLDEHNSGKHPNTARYKPWKMNTYLVFDDKKKAIDFEKYLKSGSGRAFAKRHLEFNGFNWSSTLK